jgi:hypothetical protein
MIMDFSLVPGSNSFAQLFFSAGEVCAIIGPYLLYLTSPGKKYSQGEKKGICI